MALNTEHTAITAEQNYVLQFCNDVHTLLEIAAMLIKHEMLQKDMEEIEIHPAAAQWLACLAAVLHTDTHRSRKIEYKIGSEKENLERCKWKPDFYRFLEHSLKSKSAKEGREACVRSLRHALQIFYCGPAEENQLEWQILEVCAEGVKSGMSHQTEQFLLKKTRAKDLVDKFDPTGGVREMPVDLINWLRLLMEGDRHPAVVGYLLDLLPKDYRKLMVREMSEYAPSPAMLVALQSRLDSYVLANDRSRGKMFGLVCFNEFEKCDKMKRIEANEEAESIITAMQNAGINVETLSNWDITELADTIQKFGNRVKNQCSAVFICIMSHGFKGVIHGNNSSKDVYSINQTLQTVEAEIPDFVPKVIIVQACQGNNSRSSCNDSLGIGIDHPHIEVTIPETVLMMSTVYGETSNRNHFIPALAKHLGQPDGKTSLHEMFTMAITDCQRQQRMDAAYDVQKPLFISSAKNIIIPRG